MSDTATNKITGVGTIIVPVSDQDKAIEFYTTKLGFEKRTDIPMGQADRWVEVAAPGSVTTIAIVPPRPGEPCGISTRVAFSTDDVEGDHASLLANGVDVDAEIMNHGDPVPPMFFFRDLDNNSFLVVQRS